VFLLLLPGYWNCCLTNCLPPVGVLPFKMEQDMWSWFTMETDKQRKPVYQQLISSGWNAQTRAVPTTSTNGDTSQMPIMHELDLYNKTMADLRAICNQYNIRTGKAKKDYEENILKRSNTMNHFILPLYATNQICLCHPENYQPKSELPHLN